MNFDSEEPDQAPDKEDLEKESAPDIPHFPKPDRVVVESYIINQEAFITYTKNLLQMATFLQLTLSKCQYTDPCTGTKCDGLPPYTVKSHPRATAMILEWVSLLLKSKLVFYKKR